MGSVTHRPPPGKLPADPNGPVGGTTGERPAEPSLDERLDEALDESFPASDPPAVHRLHRGPACRS
jgi:hypothetical protein